MSKNSKVNVENISSKPSLLWFRQDLRLDDNPALNAAVKRNAPIIPVYIWSPHDEVIWSPGAAAQVWLHQSLVAFKDELTDLGSFLVIRNGDALSELQDLIKETNAGAVFWNRRYEPAVIDRDKKIKEKLSEDDSLLVKSFNGSLLYEPWQMLQKNGKPYQVYTAFWRACLNEGHTAMPLKKPSQLKNPDRWPKSLGVDDLELMPIINWETAIVKFWPAGTLAAKQKLKKFIAENLGQYNISRNRPDLPCVSYLSPYLHLGQLSPKQILCSVQSAIEKSASKDFKDSAHIYLKELFWREFAYYLLYHFPYTSDKPLREQYVKFPWHKNKKQLKAWQEGKTGYPIVDAGMRQLWELGWMHNRVRMIVASFLVKDLLIPWQDGAKWFWDTLVDADLANNTLGWQWSAGCGADAAPYFRIFNPISQGKRFDPNGSYIKRFVPELKNLKAEYIHAPWLADGEALLKAKIILGKDYPEPMVDHAQARLNALEALRQIKR